MKTAFSPAQIAQITAVLKEGVIPPLASSRDEQCKRLATAFLAIAINPHRAHEWYHATMTAADLIEACGTARDFLLAFRGQISDAVRDFVPTAAIERAPVPVSIAADVVDDAPEPVAVEAAPEPVAARKWGRRDLDGVSISTTIDANWRRPGSHGWRTVQIIIENPGLMIDQIEEMGGRSRDVIEDLTKNPENLTLTPTK